MLCRGHDTTGPGYTEARTGSHFLFPENVEVAAHEDLQARYLVIAQRADQITEALYALLVPLT